LIEFSKYIKDDANYLSNQTQYNERSFAKRSEKELIEEFKNTFKIFVETENINVLNAYIDKLIIEFSYDNNSVYIIFNIY
jgi:thiaminase